MYVIYPRRRVYASLGKMSRAGAENCVRSAAFAAPLPRVKFKVSTVKSCAQKQLQIDTLLVESRVGRAGRGKKKVHKSWARANARRREGVSRRFSSLYSYSSAKMALIGSLYGPESTTIREEGSAVNGLITKSRSRRPTCMRTAGRFCYSIKGPASGQVAYLTIDRDVTATQGGAQVHGRVRTCILHSVANYVY